MKIGVIIPAAGQGKRMQSSVNKQYLELNDRPLLAHTLDKFYNNPKIEQIITVVRRKEMSFCKKEILEKYNYHQIKLVAGGRTRQQSVYAGLMAFSPAINYVIIHDGARPLLSDEVIDRTIKNLKKYPALTTGVNVKDTIKQKDRTGFVNKTLLRDKLTAVQTPQAFKFSLIKRAHEEWQGDTKATDDASLVEALGENVKIIEGDYRNIKVTTPVDLIYAEALLKSEYSN